MLAKGDLVMSKRKEKKDIKMTIFIMVVGIGIFPINADLLKIIDQCIVGILNYFFSKWFIFNTTNRFQVNVLSKLKHDKTREEPNLDRDK